MPVLVGAFLQEPRDCLSAALGIALVPQLPPVRPQPVAQRPRLRLHGAPRLVMMHGQLLQHFLGADLGHATRVAHGALQLPTKLPR